MTTRTRLTAALATGVLSAVAALPAGCTTTAPTRPQVGAPTPSGAGDAYYPGLGNTGYQVHHYTLDLTIDPVTGYLSGTATIQALATRRLPWLSLDLVGLAVSRVTVDDTPATVDRPPGKLRVTPQHEVPAGAGFTLTVDYHGTPQPIPDPSGDRTGAARVGWHHDGDEVYVASEPGGARTWYPVDDTPRDKAGYTFRITVPAGYLAVANGLPDGGTPSGTATTYTWTSRHPIASYLTTVDIGHFVQQRGTGPQALPILGYAPPGLAAQSAQRFAQVPNIIGYFESILGPYPFESAGQVVVDQPFRWSLETQTRPVYGNQILTLPPDVAQEGISHELAHQWFGDSVSLHDWSDIWLNEGFATYLSWLWLEHLGRRDYLTGLMTNQYGYLLHAPDYAALLTQPTMPPARILDILRRLFQPNGHPVTDADTLTAMGLTSATQLTPTRALGLLGVKPGSADATGYLQSAHSTAPLHPPRDDLFATAVYTRGAMTLQALRLRVGDPTFFTILRTYAAAYRYGTATTPDFIATANRLTGQDLKPFFHTWLDQPTAPPMPALLPTQ